MTVPELIADLRAEHDALDAIVAGADDDAIRTPTPSPGWTVADQLAHLTYFDGTATTAIEDPGGFAAANEALFAAIAEGRSADDVSLGWSRDLGAAELLARWRSGRAALLTAAATLADDDRVPWYGPSMGAKSFLTARLMETWAHGRDVADALGATQPATDRLRHVAQIGVITRKWSYLNRGTDVPPGDVAVVLTAPSGEAWTWGDPDTADARVEGPAEDFCLVVTQRRHLDDTALVCTGDLAADWMAKAQAFAGPPTDGPAASDGPAS